MIYVTCPHCGKTIRAGKKLAGTTCNCPACGGAIQIPSVSPPSPLPLHEVAKIGRFMECPDCGKLMSKSASSCPNCGHPFVELSRHSRHSASDQPQLIEQTKKVHKRKQLIGIGIVLLSVIVSLIGVGLAESAKPKTADIILTSTYVISLFGFSLGGVIWLSARIAAWWETG